MKFKLLNRSILSILLLASLNISLWTRAAPDFQTLGDDRWADIFALSGFDGVVNILAVDSLGKIYAGGDFTAIGGMRANHIARWDGSTWSALGDGLEQPLNNLAVDHQGHVYTNILVTQAAGPAETLIVKWDGTTWAPVGGDLGRVVDSLAEGRDSNAVINVLAVDDQDHLYAGGYFYLPNDQEQTDRYVGFVVRWNGIGWSNLGGGMNHTVYSLAVDSSGNVYAGGEFTQVESISARRVARWDGSSWSALSGGLDDTPNKMLVDNNGNLYAIVGGLSIARWDGSSWNMVASTVGGESPAIFTVATDNNNNLYAGGWFTSIEGVAANYIAKWDGSTWSALGSGLSDRVFALALNGKGEVYAGGFFTKAGGKRANHLARWDGSSWSGWDGEGGYGLNNPVAALVVDSNGNVYAGGYFTSAGSVAANRIARWDGTTWHPLGSGMDSSIHVLVVDGLGSLYAGGEFTSAGDVTANRIAMWDGSAWSALGSGVDGWYVSALVFDRQGNLYAGGDFTTAGGVPANRVAMWDGSTWHALGSGMDDQVNALAIDPDGILYAGGWFTSAGGIQAKGVARWDGSAWESLGAGSTTVDALAIDSNGIVYATGMFFIPPGSDTFTHYIAQWDGSSWTALGKGVNDFVHTLAVDNQDNLYAGGNFIEAGGKPARRIARWDGASWIALGNGIGIADDYSTVDSLAVDSNGELYVGGNFTMAGMKASSHIARWGSHVQAGIATALVTAAETVAAYTPSVTLHPTQLAGAPEASSTPIPASNPTEPVVSAAQVKLEGKYLSLGIAVLVILVLLLAGYILSRLLFGQSKNKSRLK